jgi:hypothetical protein
VIDIYIYIIYIYGVDVSSIYNYTFHFFTSHVERSRLLVVCLDNSRFVFKNLKGHTQVDAASKGKFSIVALEEEVVEGRDRRRPVEEFRYCLSVDQC